MKRKNLILIILFIFISIYSQAQEFTEKRISFSEYLDVIKSKLPELNKSTFTIEKAEATLLSSESSFDTSLSASSTYSKTSTYSSSISKTYNSKTWSLDGSVSKKIPSGTTLEAGTSYSYITQELNNSKYYRPAVYVKFTQELLKNSFGLIDRFSVTDAKMKLEIEKLRKSETDKSYLNTYKKLYFNWIAQKKKLSLLKEYITNTEKLKADIEKKVKTGLSDNTDLITVEALLLQYKLNYRNSEIKLDEIKSALYIFPELDSSAPLEDDFAKTLNLSLKFQYEMVPYEKTKSAEIYRLTKENLLYAADVQQNKLLPQLNVSGEYTRLSNSEKNNTYSNMNDSEYYIGFAFTYPLENSASRASLKQAEIAVKEINNEFDIARNSHSSNLKTTIKTIDGLRDIINISQKRIEVLESKYRNLYRQYLQSRQNLQTLVDTSIAITQQKIDLLELQNSLIQYSIDYEDLTEKIAERIK